MNPFLQKALGITLLASLLIISSWLFINSQVNHQQHQLYIENITSTQQKVSRLIQNVLLAENGGIRSFDSIAELEKEITLFLPQLESNNRASSTFVSEINDILSTVNRIKSTYAIFHNSFLYFPKGSSQLRTTLIENGQTICAKKLATLEREILLYSHSYTQVQTRNKIINYVNHLRKKSNSLPKGLSHSVKQLLKHATTLVNHSHQLTALNHQLLSNKSAVQAQHLTNLANKAFQQNVNNALNVRQWFLFTIFLLSLSITLILLKQQTLLRHLHNNIKLLNLAHKSAEQGSFRFNFQTNVMQNSEEYSELLGYKQAELVSSYQQCLSAIHPDDRNLVSSQVKITKETGQALNVKYRQKAQNGDWLWFHTTGEVIEYNQVKKPLVITGIHANITQNKQNEDALRALAESGSTKSDNIFHTIVHQLAQSHSMCYAMISLIDENDPTQANTLAVWANGNMADNFTYPLNGSPCQQVNTNGKCFYPNNIQELFPDDQLLTDMQAVSYLGVPLKNSLGEVIGILCLLDDKPTKESAQTSILLQSLATRASIELERLNSEKNLELFARIFRDTHEGISITKPDGTIIDVNPAFSEITGYPREDVIGQNPRLLSSGKQGPQFYTEMWQSLHNKGHWQGEIWNRKKNGNLCAELLTISALKDIDGTTLNYVGIFSDITHNKEQQQKLEQMAHYDALTQLPNRVLFYDRFMQAVAHSKRTKSLLAVCFLDLDNFKPVNDTYGHNVGDQLLIEVAERIKCSIRQEDTVSRQGGDEFTLLLSDFQHPHQCEVMLHRIIQTLAQPFIIEDNHINISASLGTTIYPLDNSDIDTLIRHADQAMYHSKLAGKNRYHLFNAKQDQQVSLKNKKLRDIKQALTNNEFCLYYQPKVNMRTGDVYGVEALIRWKHPEKGLIAPLDFLHIIEETSLEIQVGEWVIAQALIQMEHWLKQGILLEVSVNIASYHLQSKTFIEQLEGLLLQQPTINPSYLQLEILESSAIGDMHIINAVIKSCQSNLGVKIALDDFGTGYSSLTHLRNLPAETIKIDKSFVMGILNDPDDYRIIDGIIGLAQSFDREVIAEGVETTKHGLKLLIMGCELAQGYAIAKPMPADEISTWLTHYTPNEAWLSCISNDVDT